MALKSRIKKAYSAIIIFQESSYFGNNTLQWSFNKATVHFCAFGKKSSTAS